MGKFVGLIGTISGKVGTVVYQKGERGISYGRSWQPVVYNPKSGKQLEQRAKMNLVGQMSSITSKSLLMGMPGANSRQRRSEFTRVLLKAASVEQIAGGGYLAKVSPDDVVFSKGSIVFAATADTPVVTVSGCSVGLTLSEPSLAGRYGERIVAAVIDPNDKRGYSLVAYKDILLENSTAATVQVSFGTNIQDESLVSVYRCPFVLNENGVRQYLSLNNQNGDIVAKMLSESTSAIRDWGDSILLDSSVFTLA